MRDRTTLADTPSALIFDPSGGEVPRELMAGLTRMGYLMMERSSLSDVASLMSTVQPRIVFLALGTASVESHQTVHSFLGHLAADALLVGLTAPGTSPDSRTECLEQGMDLVFATSEDPGFILASIEAFSRTIGGGDDSPRAGDGDPSTIEIGDLVIDLGRYHVSLRGQSLELTPMEFRILAHLASRAEIVCSTSEITHAIYPDDFAAISGAEQIKTYVRRLRQKIEPNPSRPRYLRNVRGFGYVLSGDAIEVVD